MGRHVNSTPLSADAKALAADPRHVALARKIARSKAARMPWLFEEFESAAMLGLVEAARSFDPARGLRFSTHAGRRILGAILDAQRATVPSGFRRGRGGEMPRLRSLQEVADAESGACLADLVASDDGPIGWEVEAQDAVGAMLGKLPIVVRRAMLPIYADCRAEGLNRGAGQLLGLSESRISQLHNRGLEMLRSAAQHPERGGTEMAWSDSNGAHLVPVDGRPMDLDALEEIRRSKIPPGADAAKAGYRAGPPDPDHRAAELIRRREASKPAPPAAPAEPEAPTKRKSSFRGVSWAPSKQRWTATVCPPGGGTKYAGCSADEEEAARLYDRKARELLGDRAKLNFPDEALGDPAPPIVRPKVATPLPIPVEPAPPEPIVAAEVPAVVRETKPAPAPAGDPEIAAIVALAALDPAARRRVMDWTNARFGH